MSSESAMIHVLTERVAELEAENAKLRLSLAEPHFIIEKTREERPEYAFMMMTDYVNGLFYGLTMEIDENGDNICLEDIDPRIQRMIYTRRRRKVLPKPNVPIRSVKLTFDDASGHWITFGKSGLVVLHVEEEWGTNSIKISADMIYPLLELAKKERCLMVRRKN
jgi:hypothetical protein